MARSRDPSPPARPSLPEGFRLELLDDSKALSARRRELAYAAITEGALAWSVAWAYPCEIDELNILGATMLAMRRAYLDVAAKLERARRALPEAVYVDGNRLPDLGSDAAGPVAGRCAAVVKGDAIVPAIMAASILAKVSRDRAMERYDWLYPRVRLRSAQGLPHIRASRGLPKARALAHSSG